MTTNIAKPAETISAEEADRLASRIRPSWELDEGEFGEDGALGVEALARGGVSADVTEESAPFTAPTSANDAPSATVVSGRDSAGSPTSIPRDTVIDGGLAIAIGEAQRPPAEKRDASVTESQPIAPQAPAPTRMGLGDEPAAPDGSIVSARIVSIGESPAPPAVAAAIEAQDDTDAPLEILEETSAPAPSTAPRNGPSKPPPRRGSEAPRATSQPPENGLDLPPPRAVSVSDAAPAYASQPPVAPQPASYSRADDPIDLPVQKTSRALLFAIGGLVVLGAIVGGVALMNSGSETKPPTTSVQTAAATTAKPVETSAATKPAETAKPQETGAATATATATAAVTAVPTAQPSALPSSKPTVADSDKPKPSSGSSGSGASGGNATKKPPKSGGGSNASGGGIIRDVPF